MMGFTEQEVASIIDKLTGKENINQEQLKFYYNGYLFSEDAHEKIYNPDMVLYFFKEWKARGKKPKQLIDDNVKTDYGRLKRLMLNIRNKASLQKIIESGECILSLVSRFSFDQMYDPKYFESLLFYMGFLIFYKSFEGISTYVVPNYVIKTLFWDYFREELEKEYEIVSDTREINLAVREMAFRGNLEPFISYIKEHILSTLSNRDLVHFNEKYIKVLLLALITLSPLYRLESEQENTGGYIDLFPGRDIRFPEVPYQWLWELKYLKESQRHLLEKTKTTGLHQLSACGKDTRFSGREDIKKALLIFVGKKNCYVYEGEEKEG
jgi:hypothetical protein